MKKLIFVLACLLAVTVAFVACKNDEGDANLSEESQLPEEVPTGSSGEDTSDTNETTNETTSDTTEVTTEADTTEGYYNDEQIADLLKRVDEAMSNAKYYELISKETYKGSDSSSTTTTITHFDGNCYYYSLSGSDEGSEKLEYYVKSDLMLCISGSDKYVINLTDKQYDYVINNLFGDSDDSDDGDGEESYEEMLSYFGKVEIHPTGEDNCKYRLSFSEPTSKFIEFMQSTFVSTDIDITSLSMYFNIANDYTVISSVTSMSVEMFGTTVTSETQNSYTYNVKVSFPSKINNSYTLKTFDDMFGYLDTSSGADIGLDLSKDSFVLDFDNEERLSAQLLFLLTFPEEFSEKQFTLYGIFVDHPDGYYIEFSGDNTMDAVLADGLEVPTSTRYLRMQAQLVTESVEILGETYFTSYFKILSYEIIDGDEIPTGGFIPVAGFVTSSALNIRTSPSADDSKNICGDLKYNDQVRIVGITSSGWYIIEYNWNLDGESGSVAYVNSKYISKIPADYVNIDSNGQHVNAPV